MKGPPPPFIVANYSTASISGGRGPKGTVGMLEGREWKMTARKADTSIAGTILITCTYHAGLKKKRL